MWFKKAAQRYVVQVSDTTMLIVALLSATKFCKLKMFPFRG